MKKLSKTKIAIITIISIILLNIIYILYIVFFYEDKRWSRMPWLKYTQEEIDMYSNWIKNEETK